MIDLHLHLLPGVDDGAEDLEEARQMCRLAAGDGCRALVATPHQGHDLWENGDRRRLEDLRQRVQEAVGEEITVHLGAEIRIGSGLLEQVERLPGGSVLSLAGSRYLLLEYPRAGFGSDPTELTHELVVGGWTPVYAHPEFIRGLGDDLSLIRELVAAGACFQLTAASVTGDFGRRARNLAHALLDAGCVHFVASDAHGVAWRPPGLSRARELLARRWGEETAWHLTCGNPTAVLEDRPLPQREEASRCPTREAS